MASRSITHASRRTESERRANTHRIATERCSHATVSGNLSRRLRDGVSFLQTGSRQRPERSGALSVRNLSGERSVDVRRTHSPGVNRPAAPSSQLLWSWDCLSSRSGSPESYRNRVSSLFERVGRRLSAAIRSRTPSKWSTFRPSSLGCIPPRAEEPHSGPSGECRLTKSWIVL
jgi:hypothetical protein